MLLPNDHIFHADAYAQLRRKLRRAARPYLDSHRQGKAASFYPYPTQDRSFRKARFVLGGISEGRRGIAMTREGSNRVAWQS